MADINFDRLLLPEAEEAIADVWRCLEDYDLPSPALRVDFHANSTVALAFTFEDPLWAELVRLRLSHMMGRIVPRRIPPTPHARARACLPHPHRRREGRGPDDPHTLAQIQLVGAAFDEPFWRAKRK
jgi:hypothetical protein